MTELSNYQEEFETYKASKVMENGEFLEESLTAGKANLYYNTQKSGETGNIKTIIPDISDVYLEQLEVISASAFSYNETLEKVIIQDGVEKIGARAFLRCTKLKYVQLPDSINDIDTYAFYYCENLSEINIPNALIQINDGVL